MSRVLLSAILLSALPAGAGYAPDPKVVGIVQSASPGWIIQGHSDQPLVAQTLLKEGEIPYIAHSTNAKLSIALLSSSQRWERNCTPASPCEGPYPLPKNTHDTGFWAFLTGYWHAEGKVPAIFAGSRAIDSPGPEHALIVIADGKVELGPTLTKLSAGTYEIHLIPQFATNASAPAPVTVPWNGASAAVTAPAAGLYVLDVYNSNGDRQGGHAAVLFVPASDLADQKAWTTALASIDAAAGPDTGTADDLRLNTVIAIRDGKFH